MRLCLFTFVLMSAACGNPTVLDGRSYSATCNVYSDCVGVVFGDQCAPCACPNAAISSSAKITYDADRSSAIAACGPRPAIACVACQDVAVTCKCNRCQTAAEAMVGLCGR